MLRGENKTRLSEIYPIIGPFCPSEILRSRLQTKMSHGSAFGAGDEISHPNRNVFSLLQSVTKHAASPRLLRRCGCQHCAGASVTPE